MSDVVLLEVTFYLPARPAAIGGIVHCIPGGGHYTRLGRRPSGLHGGAQWRMTHGSDECVDCNRSIRQANAPAEEGWEARIGREDLPRSQT